MIFPIISTGQQKLFCLVKTKKKESKQKSAKEQQKE